MKKRDGSGGASLTASLNSVGNSAPKVTKPKKKKAATSVTKSVANSKAKSKWFN